MDNKFLSRQERDTLRDLAQAALPGNWWVGDSAIEDGSYLGISSEYHGAFCEVVVTWEDGTPCGEGPQTAEYIAECQPSRITALLDHIDALERQVEDYRPDALSYHLVMQHLQNMQMKHGLCEPRSRLACTHCNSKDALAGLVSNYNGPKIYPAIASAQEG